MVKATYEIMVDWNNNGSFGDSNEDITADVLRMEWMMGRDFASMLTGRARGGRCLINLDNDRTAGKYNSFNSSSAIFGDILPGRAVRIRATDASGTVVLWAGFLDRINPQVSINIANTALLEAVGPLTFLNQADFDLFLPIKSDQLSGTIIGDLLDAASWPAGDRDIDAGQSTIRQYHFMKSGVLGTRDRKVKWLDAAHKVEETENGFLHEGKTGTVIFEDRTRRLGSPHTTAQVTVSDNPGAGEITYSRITQGDPLKQIFNLFTTTIQNYTVGAVQEIWKHPEAVASHADILTIEPGASYQVVALTPTDAAYDLVSPWTTLVATTDYTANSQTDGLGTDLTGSIGVAVSKFVTAMSITLTNNHATSTAYITLLRARGQPVNLDNPILVLAQDAASQGKYGIRQFPVPAELVRDSTEGQDHVRALLEIYKDPRPQVDVTINANRDATHLSHVLRRAVSDKINIEALTADVDLGIDTGFFMESMHHVVDKNEFHNVTWSNSSIEATSPWWIMDTSELGATTGLFY